MRELALRMQLRASRGNVGCKMWSPSTAWDETAIWILFGQPLSIYIYSYIYIICMYIYICIITFTHMRIHVYISTLIYLFVLVYEAIGGPRSWVTILATIRYTRPIRG